MHWVQSRRIRRKAMKCLAYKRSSSIKSLRTQFIARRMAPSPETQTYMGEEEEPLLGLTSPSEKTGIRKKSPRRSLLGRRQGPDGLLAWAVAFANFLINLAVVGLGRMSGILYVVLMNKFRVDRQTAAMPFSVQQAARNLFGPLAGILGQKYGVRKVTLVGGVIGVISAVTCYFATDMNWITVMWGLVFGICTALTTTLNQVTIDQYFEKHRTTAGGLAFSGGCVGAFFFPVVLELLIAHYGVSGTFLAMGGILLVVVPAAFFLREPPWRNKEQFEDKYRPFLKQSSENSSTIEKSNTGPPVQDASIKNYSTFHPQTSEKCSTTPPAQDASVLNSSTTPPVRNQVDFAFLRQHSAIVYQMFALTILTDDTLVDDAPMEWTFLETEPLVQELEAMQNSLKTPQPNVLSDSSGSIVDELTHSVREIRIVGSEEANPPGENSRWIFIASKLQDLSHMEETDLLAYFPAHLHVHVQRVLKSMKTLSKEVQSLTTEWQDQLQSPPDLPKPDTDPTPERSNSFLEHLKTAVLLHKNPLFLLICLCRGVFMLTFIPMVTIVVDFAVDQGLDRDSGKYVIAVLSLGDLLGRLCLGWVTDSGCVCLSRYMLVVMVALGGSTATLPYMRSEVSLMPSVLLFGMLQGSLFVRHQILVSKYMGEHEQAIGMGFINLLSGFLGFTLPYYIGYFRDIRGSYDGMFYVNGIICACVGLLWVFEPYFVRYSPNGRRDKYQELVRDTGL